MTEEIDYKELFVRMQIENEVLKQQISIPAPVTWSFPDVSFVARWVRGDPVMAMYSAFLALCIVCSILQCVALWNDIKGVKR
jgi:hypothetical protein